MEKQIAKYLYELGVLKRVRRSGWWLAGVKDAESVAEHSFRAAAAAFILAELEGADAGRAVALALFHDAAEARVGDLHRLARSYVDWSGVEAGVVRDQTRSLPPPLGAALRGLLDEARRGASREARIAKDADRLELLLQAREYAAAGHDAGEWARSAVRELRGAAARKLARAILATPPAEWRRASGSRGKVRSDRARGRKLRRSRRG
jgi:putative hydrolase of HD superfamily